MHACMHTWVWVSLPKQFNSHLQHFISVQNNIEFLVAGLVIIKSCGDFFPWYGLADYLHLALFSGSVFMKSHAWVTLRYKLQWLNSSSLSSSAYHTQGKNTLLFFCSYNTHKSVSILFPAVLLPANFFL